MMLSRVISRIPLISAALVATGCFSIDGGGRAPDKTSVETRQQAESNTCNFRRAVRSTYADASIRIASGAVINGPVTSNVNIGYETVWAAFAAPQAEVVEASGVGPGNCTMQTYPGYYQFGYWMNCPIDYKWDLGDIYGIGRGQTREDAEGLALENCEKAVSRVLSQYDELEDVADYDDLICVSTVQVCD